MAKKFKYEIIDIIAILDEDPKSNWGIALTKISWNGKEPCYDIRKYDLSTLKTGDGEDVVMGKGLSLYNYNDSLDFITDTLVEKGYGNKKKILKYLKEYEEDMYGGKKKKLFK